MKRRGFTFFVLLFAASPTLVAAAVDPGPPIVKAARACAELTTTDLAPIGGAGSRIDSAKEIDHGDMRFCEVEGTLAPNVKFRVELPVATWTQRYLQLGCGGLCGRVSIDVGAAQGCAPVAAGGFVLAATDMGHEGMDGAFGKDSGARVDFAYRAQHITALAAKALIRAYYGRDAEYSYFDGCSDGGREALMEAQRYPEEFNGIVAGAAAMAFQLQNSFYHAWQAVSNTGPDGKGILTAPRLAALHRAVLAQCASEDGLVLDPYACRFDPTAAICREGANADGCLTPVEAEAARKLYDGARDLDGRRFAAGGPLVGSELNWAGVFVPPTADAPIFSTQIALDAIKNLVFESNPPPDYALKDFTFDTATFDRLRPLHPLYDATNPDLAAFAAAGGKLILWHGLADPHISPNNAIAYHEALQRMLGESVASRFERLYLFPGVSHCGGGDGPSGVDLMSPIMAWVEHRVAPDAIVARAPAPDANLSFGSPTNDPGPPPGMGPPQPAATPQTRVVFPYPSVAHYDGQGDRAAPASYRKAIMTRPDSTSWAVSDFFRPYPPLER